MAASAGQSEQDAAKLAELASIVQAVKDRVRARYPQHSTVQSPGGRPTIQVPLADLLPVLHARDAAQARVASIGSVNPRPGGIANSLIQAVKRYIARALGWFVRGQVTFNRETVSAVEAILEALNDQNRALVSLTSQINAQIDQLNRDSSEHVEALSKQIDARFHELNSGMEVYLNQLDPLKAEAQELKDIRTHWLEWRAGWEHKLATNEVYFLRTAAELQGAFQHRVNQLEANFVEKLKGQHGDYLRALDRANLDIQKRLWEDLAKVKAEYERLIHTELRLIRLRGTASVPAPAPHPVPQPDVLAAPDFDYSRFAERFRGSEEYVLRNQEFYLPFFEGRENVLDIGCGRGEFLTVMRNAGVRAKGIDLGAESVQQCRAKGLEAEEADLFTYLDSQPDQEFDGIFSAQVVEHIHPMRLPEMIRLCAVKLRKGGILAIETPNPECLAIFATHFFIDPTHTRPVPAPLLSFYMEEAGMGAIEVHRLSPAIESIPEVAELPEALQNRFFGGLDYSIVARKL